jgi:hypothetical protein
MLVVVSVGIVVVVSMPVPDGCVVTVSDDIGGDDVSVPVELSGVSQPIVAIAKKAMKRMLFMRNTFSYEYLTGCCKKRAIIKIFITFCYKLNGNLVALSSLVCLLTRVSIKKSKLNLCSNSSTKKKSPIIGYES